ncbi:MAG: hypothetical protein IEMM0006_0925 [bacterium]|nr:MAG: hypothetical protein IEMM0006_0925 [bacterium]
MKNLKLLIALLFILPVIPQQASAQKKVWLKYNLKKGEKYISHMNANQDVDMEAQGQTISINQIVTSDISTVVSDVTPKEIKTTNTLDKMTMKQTMFGQELKYDSSDPSTFASGRGKLLGDALNKLIGKPYGITMDHLGNISAYDLSALLKGNGKISGNIKSGNNYVIFPDHKVKVGDSWEADIKPMKTDNMKIHIKYTLKKLSGKKATIGLDGTITANNIAGQNVDLSGTWTGEVVVNTKTGWTTASHISQDIKMKEERNGMEIPVTISGIVTSTSEKK